VKTYWRRRVVRWYTDEYGRRRPVTHKELVIEIPIPVARKRIRYRDLINDVPIDVYKTVQTTLDNYID